MPSLPIAIPQHGQSQNLPVSGCPLIVTALM